MSVCNQPERKFIIYAYKSSVYVNCVCATNQNARLESKPIREFRSVWPFRKQVLNLYK